MKFIVLSREKVAGLAARATKLRVISPGIFMKRSNLIDNIPIFKYF